MPRDAAWLNKKVRNKKISSYYIKGSSEVFSTIAKETEFLFEKCGREKNKDKAVLLFNIVKNDAIENEGFLIKKENGQIIIEANTPAGLLYGMYNFYRIEINKEEIKYPFISIPDQSIRMINQWDNADGSIERGYAGKSIFFRDNDFLRDYEIITQYARLLASIGVNAIAINNVNVRGVETKFILKKNLDDIKKINDIFAKFAIKMFLSVNFAAPKNAGGLKTADPLDKKVIKWWKNTVNEIYRKIPNFGGFLVKADSEGEPGPFAYSRTHADGANMLADALKHYGGLLIWRCFVYNCRQDWRDRSTDRARAAYDNFIHLDGKFNDNAALQIKYGPIDFQTREPVSPLVGGLKKTNQILELQITQEYTGQQKHICFLAPLWKEILDFDTKHTQKESLVKDVIKNNSPIRQYAGISAVANVGLDNNWMGHKMAQANLYAFGRLAWNNNLTAKQIANEWIDLTFNLNLTDKKIMEFILLSSHQTYEYYTAPLGVGFMVKPNVHYGPDIDGYEYDRWGTYHFADRNGLGVDRTLRGTAFVKQYSKKICGQYDNIKTCPDNLLLFFHHVAYSHILQSGKTVIQHIYDTHFEGVKRVEKYIKLWNKLEKTLDKESFENVAARLDEQLRCAKEWRDQMNTYFYRKSGISDEKKREIYP
jgi:alpha-glucuronidase